MILSSKSCKYTHFIGKSKKKNKQRFSRPKKDQNMAKMATQELPEYKNGIFGTKKQKLGQKKEIWDE